MPTISPTLLPILMLFASNVFMTFAWYGHLKDRIGYAGGYSLAQLKIAQEVITLLVFMPFAVLYMNQPMKLDCLWAALCLVGAAYFIFSG